MSKQALDDKRIRGLKLPASGQVDVWDKLLPGFGVRVGSAGRKSFFVGTRISGKYTRVTLKPPYPALSLADARARARQIIADAQSGVSPELRKKREERGTFGAVASAFMHDYAAHRRTRGQMQRMIDRDLAAWHSMPIASITRGDIKELIRVKARIAPIAANRLTALISRIFSWAVKEEIVGSSPALRLDRPGKEVERERSLSASEIKAVWAAFDKIGYPFGPLCKILLVTGQRRSEVAGMKWNEIHPDGWRLPSERAKRGKGHLVPLSTLAREIIDGLPQVGEYLFTTGGKRPVSGWSKVKHRVDGFANIADWQLRDMRRTMATEMRRLGVDRLVVSKLLNHAEAGVTKIYDRYAADPEKTAAMERWANRLREIISGKPVDNVVQLRSLA
jgi:integrase